MNITVWTLTVNNDTGHPSARVFTSEPEALKAYANIVCVSAEAYAQACAVIERSGRAAAYEFLGRQHKEMDTYLIERHSIDPLPCDLPEETQKALVEQARENYQRSDNDVDIDDNPAISDSEEGAFVAAWVWVSWSDIGVCPGCKEKKELGDCDEICAECFAAQEKAKA